MKKKRFALYVLNDESERLNGYYCGFWTQFWGMEQYPDVDDTITDQSGNLIKKLKTYTTYNRAVYGAKCCLINIGSGWHVRIINLEKPDQTHCDYSKGIYPAYDYEGKPIIESLEWD